MKNIGKFLILALFSIMGIVVLYFIINLAITCQFRLSDYIFPDSKTELIFIVISCLIGFCIMFYTIYFIFKNKFETDKQKIKLFIYVNLCCLIMLFFGDFLSRGYISEVLAIVQNSKKAVEIIDFLEDEPISIAKSNDKYLIISKRGYIKDNSKILIKLAENNLINEDFVQDDNFDKIKSRYYYVKMRGQPNRLKKYVEREIKNQIKYIDGVSNVEVEFIPSLENQNYKYIINVQTFDNSDREKIKKIINSLLSLYPGENKTINFLK